MENFLKEKNTEGLEHVDFNSAYEEIKTILARTPPVSIIKRSIKMLHEMYHKKNFDRPIYVPWIPLALIEWSLVFGPKSNILLTTEITDEGYNHLYNLLHNDPGFEAKFLKTGNPIDTMKFVRCIAHQQFWFQGGKSQLRRFIGRNFLLMNNFNADFLKFTGLTINEFHELLFVVFAKFQNIDHRNFIDKKFFSNLEKKYNHHQIDLFFNLMSLTLDELQDSIRTHYKFYEKNYEAQTLLSQMTPLWRFPFLNENGNYVCIYPALIEYAIEYFVYDYLKLKQKGSFSRPFGRVMEDHIRKGLEFSSINFLDETQLQKIAEPYRAKRQGKIKSVDFLVRQSNGTLLIESKAQEMPAEVKINPENKILGKCFPPDDRHVFYGIIQAFELCDFITQQNPPDLQGFKNDFYLILVTYKDFYLGRGEEFWEEFVKDIVNPTLERKSISTDLIKPERIFVISIDEYDCLISQAKQCNVDIIDILKFAIERDKKSDTRHVVIGGHINAYNPETRPNLPYLEESFETITNSVIAFLRDSEKNKSSIKI